MIIKFNILIKINIFDLNFGIYNYFQINYVSKCILTIIDKKNIYLKLHSKEYL